MLTASALDNAFDFDLGLDWWTAVKLRPGENKNWMKTCCYILTLAKAVEILKTPQNPNFWVPKKILVYCTATCCYSWETELVGRAKKMWCQQHPVFPGGHPSKYWLGSTLLNFSDRTRTGVFSVIWPLASERVEIKHFDPLTALANSSWSSNT